MLPIQTRIERAQRLLDMLERDAPLLAFRFSALGSERRRFAQEYAAQLAERAKAELEKLRQHQSNWESENNFPEAAD